jgi:hypothetical protein
MEDVLEPIEMLLSVPLYRRFRADSTQVLELRDYKTPIDAFCTHCKEQSVFQREDRTPSEAMAGLMYPGGGYDFDAKTVPLVFSMTFFCSRDKNHKMVFIFRKLREEFSKIGEYPSRVDRDTPILSRYEKELSDQYQNYKSAIYLFNHGIGIGSYAYLRRVLENIIDQVATQTYGGTKDWSLDEWKRDKRFSDMIFDLKDNLPDFLLENPKIYGVLSKGLHELDEEECIAYFPIVREAIEEILEDRIKQSEDAKRRKSVSDQLERIESELKK